MDQRNQCYHIFERNSSSCMNNFNAGTQFIKYKIYQISTKKLI